MQSSLREVSCRQAGLPARAIVEARSAGSDEIVSCVLAGRLDELFETLPADERSDAAAGLGGERP